MINKYCEKVLCVCDLYCGARPSFLDACRGCMPDFEREGCKNFAGHGFWGAISQLPSSMSAEFLCNKLKEFSARSIIDKIRSLGILDSLRMREV